ncbi:MAG: glycosyltransferase family 39 protein [bacterium]
MSDLDNNPMKSGIVISLILILSLGLNFYAIWWGLPSQSRNQLYYSGKSQIKSETDLITESMVTKSLTDGKSLPTSVYNPIRTYHPFEESILKSVSNMNPCKLDFNPKYYFYGSLYIYLVAFFLGIGALLNILTITTDIQFYFLHPFEMAKIYLVGRSLSALLATMSVYLTYLIGKKIRGEGHGLLAAIIMAITPVFVINAHFLVPDVTMVFFVTLSFFFLVRILESDRMKYYILFGITSGLAGSSKYPGGLILFVLPLSFLIRDYSKQSLRKTRERSIIKKLLLTFLSALLTFVILNPYMFFYSKKTGRVINIYLQQYGHIAQNFLSTLFSFVNLTRWGLSCPLLIISALGLMLFIRQGKKSEKLAVIWIALYYLFFALAKFQMVRYILPIVPFLALAGAFSILSICRWLKEKSLHWMLYLFTCMIIISLGWVFLYTVAFENIMSGEIRTEAGRWISKNIPENSKIGMVRDPWQFEIPPLNKEKYRLVIINNAEQLAEKECSYFIISDFQQWSGMMEILRSHNSYIKIKEFEKCPCILGISFPKGNPPHDWKYIYPTTTVFKRVKGE